MIKNRTVCLSEGDGSTSVTLINYVQNGPMNPSLLETKTVTNGLVLIGPYFHPNGSEEQSNDSDMHFFNSAPHLHQTKHFFVTKSQNNQNYLKLKARPLVESDNENIAAFSRSMANGFIFGLTKKALWLISDDTLQGNKSRKEIIKFREDQHFDFKDRSINVFATSYSGGSNEKHYCLVANGGKLQYARSGTPSTLMTLQNPQIKDVYYVDFVNIKETRHFIAVSTSNFICYIYIHMGVIVTLYWQLDIFVLL